MGEEGRVFFFSFFLKKRKEKGLGAARGIEAGERVDRWMYCRFCFGKSKFGTNE